MALGKTTLGKNVSKPGLGSKQTSIISVRNVAIAVVVIVIAFLLLQPSGVATINSNNTVTINLNSTYNFKLPDNNSVASLYLASSSGSGATLYLSKLPVLENNIFVVPLQKGTVVNVSVYGGSAADLQISLISSAATGAIVSLYYIPHNLNLHPASLQMLGSSSVGQTTAPTTTVPSLTTSPQQTTTIQATTTVPKLNASGTALADANSSIYGVLANNYKTLYLKEASQCTPSTYNSTYITKHQTSPKGPNTFQNVSIATPTSIVSSIKQLSATLYNITYVAVIGIGNTPSLVIEINSTTKFVKTYTFEGIFQGMTYSDALTQYQAFNQSSNPCELYVP
ncbi:MAG: hypothetical protein KGH67_01795 [Candidatus Micrarchaeota archaeon]|nr:hypothetical protein [Candidatus Micrarchaeota archaeon]MDE1859239.1 hypothetical protein [Candidatus Micrarchaeota archaeon]